MAYPVALDSLSPEDRAAIPHDATIVPQLPATAKRAMAAGRQVHATVAPPFAFYAHDAASNAVLLPLSYGRARAGAGVDDDDDGGAWAPLTRAKPALALRDEQVAITDTCFRHLRETGGATIQAQPGAGKTVMGITLAMRLGLRYCVLYPTGPIGKQWVATAARVVTGSEDDAAALVESGVFCVVDQAAVERRSGAAAASAAAADAVFALGERARSLPQHLRHPVGTLIIDEAHLFCVPSAVATILSFEPKYVIVLTATLERENAAHRMMRLLAGTEEVVRPPARAYRVIAYQTNLVMPETAHPAKGTLDYTALCSAMAASDEYTRAIADVVAANPARKFIVLSRMVGHSETIAAACADRGVEVSVLSGRKTRASDARVLCGTMSKIGTGFDAATFLDRFGGRSPDTLILAHTVKQWQAYTQLVGRVMRAAAGVVPVVVYMLTRNRITASHLSGLSRYIASTGGAIEKAVRGAGAGAGGALLIDAPPQPPAAGAAGAAAAAAHTDDN
jgi:hypothetical protein